MQQVERGALDLDDRVIEHIAEWRQAGGADATVRDLLNERGQIERYADVRAFTSQATSRLEVLASDRDPTVSVAFSASPLLVQVTVPELRTQPVLAETNVVPDGRMSESV